jgi:uncharacterized protein (TIGR02246 family)
MSSTFRFVQLTVLAVLMVVGSSAGAQEGQARPAPGAHEIDVRKLFEAYEQAVNKHDTKAVAQFWQEDGTYESKSTKVKAQGPAEVAALYEKLFKADPKCEVSIEVKKLRMLGVAAIFDCTVAVKHTHGEVTHSELNGAALHEGNSWQIVQVVETDVPAPDSAAGQFRDLAWLVGKWSDDTSTGRVVNQFVWTSGRSFLARNYRQESQGNVVREGTQIIGWDAEHQCLRCWLFDGDGTFGEGLVVREAPNKWVIKLALKLADGRRGSLSQLVERAGHGTLKLQITEREVDGQALPSSEVATLVREKNEPPSK